MSRFNFIPLFCILVILLTACNANSASKTATPANLSQESITETFTPIPTATWTQTSTPTNVPSAIPTQPQTPTPTPTLRPTVTSTPTATATPLPTDTPDIAEFGFQEYVHPSGRFTLNMASRDVSMIEMEDAVFFTDGFHLIMAGFIEQEVPLDATNWMTATQSFADYFLVEWSLISSYDQLERVEPGSDDVYLIRFDYLAAEAPINEGIGEILLEQHDNLLYGVVLLTPDYHDVEFVWGIVKESFAPTEEE